MSRLVIHAWFPYLAAERLRRAGDAATGDATGDVPAGVPLVLTGARHGAEIVESVCRLAHRRGLHAGMRLADARALCPELVSRDSDPAADAADLLHLARWARRYCPLTAPEQADRPSAPDLSAGGPPSRMPATGCGSTLPARRIFRAGSGRFLPTWRGVCGGPG